MPRPEPVRVGDQYRDQQGRTWRCIQGLPCGVRELFCEAESRFMRTTVRQIRLGTLVRT